MNLDINNKQALELAVFLKKQNSFPMVSLQIDANFKKMEVSELLTLQDQFTTIFTVEFFIECVKCGKEFMSVSESRKKVPIKHTAKCPNCNTKHFWNGNS